MAPTYRGHRECSYYAVDSIELEEIRTRQRTFDGAYSRAAMGVLCQGVLILKLFDKRFYRIGLLYTILAALFFAVSLVRRRISNRDFSDGYRVPGDELKAKRSFGRPFMTGGWTVIGISGLVAMVEIALIGLIVRL